MRKSKILWNRFELKIFMFIVHAVTCGWRTLQRPPYSWCTVPKYHNHMCTWSDSLPKHTNEKEGCTNKCKGMVFTLYLDLPVSLRPPLLDKGKTQFAAFSPGHFITSPFQTDKTKQTKQTKKDKTDKTPGHFISSPFQTDKTIQALSCQVWIKPPDSSTEPPCKANWTKNQQISARNCCCIRLQTS